MSHPLTSYEILLIETATRLLAARISNSREPISRMDVDTALNTAVQLIARARQT